MIAIFPHTSRLDPKMMPELPQDSWKLFSPEIFLIFFKPIKVIWFLTLFDISQESNFSWLFWKIEFLNTVPVISIWLKQF